MFVSRRTDPPLESLRGSAIVPRFGTSQVLRRFTHARGRGHGRGPVSVESVKRNVDPIEPEVTWLVGAYAVVYLDLVAICVSHRRFVNAVHRYDYQSKLNDVVHTTRGTNQQ